jgi:hypothetical protein
MANSRFAGAWILDSFETEQADGSRSRPWGDDPLGIIVWDATGYFSAQLGPRVPRVESPWVAYYGTLEAPDGDSGTLVHTVLGSSNPARLSAPQSREFRFVDANTLVLRPPVAENGSRGALTWKRMT